MSAGIVCCLSATLGRHVDLGHFLADSLVGRTRRRPLAPPAASELSQLGAGCSDAHPVLTEVDDQGGVILDAYDPAEAVLVVSDLVLHGELLGGRGGRWGLEGACGQEAPGRGAGRLHHL
jgi:hypothetical protein